MTTRIVVATSDVFVRRLTPALASMVRERRDFRIIDIYRPFSELRSLIREITPAVIITESLPRITKSIVALGYPTVIADTDEIFPGSASVDVDDQKVGEVAARFFLDSGYRSFAFSGSRTPYAAQRLEGYRRALGAAGHTCAALFLDEPKARHYMESWTRPSEELKRWLRRLPKPVAVFTSHDPMGRSVCEAAREIGLAIPDDVAVVGANNDELVCGLSYPPLSSVAIPWGRVGALAGLLAQSFIEGKTAPSEALLVQPGPVVVRQSTTLLAVDDPDLRRALQYLRTHHTEAMTIEEMCRNTHLSRRRIERKFSRILESSPWDVLCRMRVETAKRILVETDLPMSLVAEQSGFGDAERFSVVFRRHANVPPSAFRKSSRNAG